jgi:hypothetical protein
LKTFKKAEEGYKPITQDKLGLLGSFHPVLVMLLLKKMRIDGTFQRNTTVNTELVLQLLLKGGQGTIIRKKHRPLSKV